MFKNIPDNVKLILSSVGPLIIVIILFFVVGNFGVSRIKLQRSQIKEEENAKQILTQKLNLLQSVSGTVAADSGFSIAAIPDKNPALVVIYQLRVAGARNGIVLSNIKSGGENKDNSGLSRVDISFDIIGPKTQVISFLKSIETITPITNLVKVQINEAGGITRTTANVNSFFAPLPTKLPSLTQPIGDLTQAEKQTLIDISGFVQAPFSSLPPAPGGRVDPFSVQ